MTVTAAARGYYDVTSERDETVSYMVDPKAINCTCPDFRARRAEKAIDDPQRCCKHLRQVMAHLAATPQPTKLEEAAETAKMLDDIDLRLYAKKYQGQAAGAACLLEMAHRVVAALAAQPRPIPEGVLALLQGATEAEKARALEIYR